MTSQEHLERLIGALFVQVAVLRAQLDACRDELARRPPAGEPPPP